VYPGWAYHLILQGELAYVVGGADGLQIVDVSNPASPTLRSTYPDVQDIAIVGEVVYALDTSGFKILDVSAPDHPLLLGRFTLQDPWSKPADLTAVSSIVYMTLPPEVGLLVVDVSDPASPVQKAIYPDYVGKVQVEGHYLIAAAGIGLTGMHIFDVSTPAAPRPRSAYGLPDQFQVVQLENNLVFVADGQGGLQIIRLHPDLFPPDQYLPMIRVTEAE
jgi:hypothetical protein